MMKRHLHHLHKNRSGQAMVEFAIVFPALFMLILLIMQTTLILTARQMVHYAAYNGARSVIVHMNAETSSEYLEKATDAAAVSCIPISPSFTIGSLPIDVTLPPAIDAAVSNMQVYLAKYVLSRYLLTRVKVFDGSGTSLTTDTSGKKIDPPRTLSPGDDVTVQVTHYYVMRIPLINKLFFKMYWLNKAEEELGFDDTSFFDTIGIDLSELTGSISDYLMGLIDLPGYWIPISATSTLTVQGQGDSAN